MNPQNDQRNGQVGAPQRDQFTRQSVTPPARQSSPQQAAAEVIRGQLQSIYNGGSGEDTPHTTPVSQPEVSTPTAPISTPAPTVTSTPTAPTEHAMRTMPVQPSPVVEPTAKTAEPQVQSAYQRTMTEDSQPPQPSQEQWRQYHSAWQKYYQLYYERSYLNSVYRQEQAEKKTNTNEDVPVQSEGAALSQDQAMKELRRSIRQKVTGSAEKVKKSRHFIPALAGIGVLLLFMLLQYNRILFGAIAAYASPGNIEPQNVIVDPTVDVEVGEEPRMIIPKINVDAPVVYGIGPDYKSQMTAMEKGIAHFSIPKANAVPGQVGNAVFAAHSSNDAFAQGDYKFVFAQNEKLTTGDVIYMNYEGKRYTYSVTKTEVVLPNEVSKVQMDTDKPMLTLVSCVPLGTAQKRLLIFAEQISPDPGKAQQAQTDTAAPEATDIPGKPTPTLLERLFGAS